MARWNKGNLGVRLGAKARRLLGGVSLGFVALLAAQPAAATARHHGFHHIVHHAGHHVLHETAYRHHRLGGHVEHFRSHREAYHHEHGYYGHHLRYAARYRHSGLQCVPYAREVSQIDLTGNAFLWWAEAAGRYARGNAPVEGAVLNFRAIGRMPLGHVAVVTSVINSRTILVTQANWVRGTITNDVTVQDVSPDNDWSDVQVELGDSSTWGAAYPTYGFIYNKPESATVVAANGASNEVAEAPAVAQIATEAPDRDLQ